MEAIHANLEAEGSLLSAEVLRRYYGTFRQRFGPDVLSRLEGQELLDVLKGPGKEGLVYWLEFKDDEELPARFGSIAGGDAIAIATGHRDQCWPRQSSWTLLDTLNKDQVDEADYISCRQSSPLPRTSAPRR
jgi:hypothetical protein